MIARSFLIVLLSMSFAAIADGDRVLSDDGREVQLNKDGTWDFVSEDRFATTRDGRRVRLKPDGSWEYAEEDPAWMTVPTRSLGLSLDEVTESDSSYHLSQVVIESVRSRQQKNSRLSAQIVMTLETTADVGRVDPDSVTVSDSKGRIYPTKSVRRLDNGYQIIADGSPRWWGVKFFRLIIAENALGNTASVEMTKAMGEILKRDVQELSD